MRSLLSLSLTDHYKLVYPERGLCCANRLQNWIIDKNARPGKTRKLKFLIVNFNISLISALI